MLFTSLFLEWVNVFHMFGLMLEMLFLATNLSMSNSTDPA